MLINSETNLPTLEPLPDIWVNKTATTGKSKITTIGIRYLFGTIFIAINNIINIAAVIKFMKANNIPKFLLATFFLI